MDAEERIEQLTLELARTQEELARVNARLNAIMQGADCVAAVLKNGCNQVDQSVFDEDTKLHVGARGFHTFIEFFRDITSRQCDSDLRVVSFVVNHLQQKSKSGRPADLVQGYGAAAFRLLRDVGYKEQSACKLLKRLLATVDLRNKEGHPVLAEHIERWDFRILYQKDSPAEAKFHYDQLLEHRRAILNSLPVEQRRLWAESHVGEIIDHLKKFHDGQARPRNIMT